MALLRVLYRLIVRPLAHEPVRTSLTVLAIALGVAVVLAIDLAGTAATGSFHSSMETLAGENDLEITSVGGVPEGVMGALVSLPYSIRFSPRVEDFAVVEDTQQTLPLLGLDLMGETGNRGGLPAGTQIEQREDALKHLGEDDSIWVGASLKRKPGDKLDLLINDQIHTYVVRAVFPDSGGNASAIVMDIAVAQRALGKAGRLDRILAKLPAGRSVEEWERRVATVLPAGVQVRTAGASTDDNRKMLAAFRWNLRLLSYIALVVGAFLIYNTVSVSVVRRRAEIGIVRALGMSRGAVLTGFLGEAASFGLLGAMIGLPLGRVMAGACLKLMAVTVNSLYVSSQPGPMHLDGGSVELALAMGLGVAVVSAYPPAREASRVPPVEAMARGRIEYVARVHRMRDLSLAVGFGVAAAIASRAPAIAGKPIFGYLAALLLIISSALAIPEMVYVLTDLPSKILGKVFGVEALLGSRSLSASLSRTSVLVAALSTAIAMMTSIGIMVGSFRETVLRWMEDQLPADLYMRPAGDPAADRHPTISVQLADAIEALPGVTNIDRLRAYETNYEGMPAGLASVELNILRAYREADFLSGRPTKQVLADMHNANAVVVSEPFANKHHLRAGDSITLPLGTSRATFRVADIYYDYSSERGSILMDRNVMLRYLPDGAPSNLAIYLAPNARVQVVREEIERVSAGHRVLIFSNRDLRREALRVFDRTFAITYALEGVAVLVAVMGVAGALLALVIDRRRELGLLRFLGASSGQVRKLIMVEAGLVGLLATFAGVVLGLAMSVVLIFVINKQSFGWTIRFHWPVAILLAALGVVYVATVLAGLYPASVAVRLNPIEVVHEE